MELFRATLLPPPPDLLGAPHSLRPPGLLPLPLSIVAGGSSKVSGFWARMLRGGLMGGQETPPLAPQHTYIEAPLPYRIPVALLPVE